MRIGCRWCASIHDPLERLEVGVLAEGGACCRPIGSAHGTPARRVLFAFSWYG